MIVRDVEEIGGAWPVDPIYIPIPEGSKETRVRGWSSIPPPPMPVGPDHNRALRLDDETDIDLDCREAKFAAPRFLPRTDRQHGRPSGVSHLWYRAQGAEYEAFTDVVKDAYGKDQTLIEIRTGHDHYTVVPPSRVPVKGNGALETLRWFAEGTPATCDFSLLRERVVYVAITALLARHMIGDGERWKFYEALAGFLLGSVKLPADAATNILETVADIVGDRDTAPRPAEWVRRTEARIRRGDECSGAPTVATMIGEHGPAVVKQIRRWCRVESGLEHPLTEAGDAECFANLYRDRLRYDHRRGRWLLSDAASGIWLPDPTESLTQMAVEAMRARQRQALALTDPDQKKKAIAWAIAGEARKRLTNAVLLARSVPPIADPGEGWDEHPFLLGVQNGVIELQSGQFRRARPDDRVTMRVRVAYDPAATCPLWAETLSSIFASADNVALPDLANKQAESQRVIEFMQRALGYSITGDCREECCFFCWGDGANGKGTVMNTLGWLLGDYTDDMPYSTLERSERGSGIPNDVAKLVGRRFITCAEVNEFNLNEARLKALTGRDPMTARFLHREFFTFIPVCKIWIATNNKPKIDGQDDGIWRRIHLIPFTRKFEGASQNKRLKDQLRDELPGILNWILEGARLWLRDGLNPPDTVKAATAAYRQESNPITPFIEQCCVVGGGGMNVQAKQAYEAYERFCRDSGVEQWRRLTNKAFFKAMEQRFEKVERREVTRQKFYVGVGLRDEKHEQQPRAVDDSMAANPGECSGGVPF